MRDTLQYIYIKGCEQADIIYQPNLSWSLVNTGGFQMRHSEWIRRFRFAFDLSYFSRTASERQITCCPL